MSNTEVIAALGRLRAKYLDLLVEAKGHQEALAQVTEAAMRLNHGLEQFHAQVSDNQRALDKLLAIMQERNRDDSGEEWKSR